MTYIDPERAVRMNVVRLITTYDADGNLIMESYSSVYGEHWADIQPLSNSARIIAEQLKFKATHRIFPESYLGGIVKVDDFYRHGTSRYRVTGINDFRNVAYFDAWHDASGILQPEVHLSRSFFVVEGAGAGTYTFGSGIFAGVPPFSSAPEIHPVLTNDGSFYITGISATGFTIVDRGLGLPPVLTIYVLQSIGMTEIDRYYVSGLATGSYMFGSGVLASVPEFTQAPDVIGIPMNDGFAHIDNITTTGFRIVSAETGANMLSYAVEIRKKPAVTERRWSFSGLTEGSYTFGGGSLAGMPTSFLKTPMIHFQENNDSRIFLQSKSTTGFTLTWRGIGKTPSVTVTIQEI